MGKMVSLRSRSSFHNKAATHSKSINKARTPIRRQEIIPQMETRHRLVKMATNLNFNNNPSKLAFRLNHNTPTTPNQFNSMSKLLRLIRRIIWQTANPQPNHRGEWALVSKNSGRMLLQVKRWLLALVERSLPVL
jgi:hypothetical protein